MVLNIAILVYEFKKRIPLIEDFLINDHRCSLREAIMCVRLDSVRRKLSLYVSFSVLTSLYVVGFIIFIKPNITEDYEFVHHLLYSGAYVGCYHMIIDFLSIVVLLVVTLSYLLFYPFGKMCCSSVLSQRYIIQNDQERRIENQRAIEEEKVKQVSNFIKAHTLSVISLRSILT